MRLSSEVREKILQVAKKARPRSKRIEIKGRFWFKRHCGQRMVRVKTFSGDGCQADNEYSQTENDCWNLVICSCPTCEYYFDDMPSD